MRRDIESDLIRWKDQKGRMPLLIRGARQVGKTYLVKTFGDEHFESVLTINFEKNPQYKKCFRSLSSKEIKKALELSTGRIITPGKTLVFLDEIQDCPKAIQALRYFKEEMPDLHVIGAGSLLELVLNDANFRMPVGRVQFLYLRPFSFGEFLDAAGHSHLRSYLKEVVLEEPVNEAVHAKLLSLVKEYAAIGGMPAALAAYLSNQDILQCQEVQSALLFGFRKDFGKYAARMPHEHLELIFNKAPGLIGKWLKYSTLSSDVAAATLRNALSKLCDAGLITRIFATSAAGLPFITHRNEKKCKMLFLDIGLVKRACGLDLNMLLDSHFSAINEGALAEQFVGQELLAYHEKYEGCELYSWVREAKSSSAEVDYLISARGKIVPIEVKAGSTGAMKSLKILMKEKKLSLGVKISEEPLVLKENILSLPFYMIEELPRMLALNSSAWL